MATTFRIFIEIPSTSRLDLDWKFFMTSAIAPVLLIVNSNMWVFLCFIKVLGATGVSLIEFAIFSQH